MSLKLTTTAFPSEGPIPVKYSKKGGNVSPPLAWSGVPEGTRSLALIVDDPDAPVGLFVHWVVYRIPPTSTGLKEHLPEAGTLPDGSRQGRNGFGEIGYGGPQPPSGKHRYFFHLYALDTVPDLGPGAGRQQLDRQMQGHIIDQSDIMGTFEARKAA